jgi:hypothetical protein
LLCALARSQEQNLRPRTQQGRGSARKQLNLGCRLLRGALQRANAAEKSIKLQVLRFASKLLVEFVGVEVDEGFGVYIRDSVILLLQAGQADVRALAVHVFSLVATGEVDEDSIGALRIALDDVSTDVKVEVLKLLEGSATNWESLAQDVAVCAMLDSDAIVRRLAFQALSVSKAKEWLNDGVLLHLILSGVRDVDESVRDGCAFMLIRRWRGCDIAEQLDRLTQNTKEQDLIIALLVRGGLSLPVKYFRDKIDALSSVAARLWLAYLNNCAPESRELLLPSVPAFAAALEYYSSENDQFVTFCAMLPSYDSAQYEAQREHLSNILRKVVLASDDVVAVHILEAALDVLKVLHPETRDWVQVCLEIVVDLIDDDLRGAEGVQWPSALHVAHNILQDPRVSLNQAGMQELLHNVLLQGIGSQQASVRALAVRTLGCLCTLSFEHTKTYMLLFATVLNKDLLEVQVEAAKAILDFCVIYGAALAPNLTAEALNELSDGPQCVDEPNPVLSRVLSPLDIREAHHSLQEIACVGVAKMLFYGRLQSYSMLGRAVAKATEGFPVMEQFAQEFAQRAPKMCLPHLRHSLPFAVLRLRGKQQGSALRIIAKNWNVPWDSLAAQALVAGGDPIAIASMAPSGAAKEALREAVISRLGTEKSSVFRDALRQWAADRDMTIPGDGWGVKKTKKKTTKKASSSDHESDSFASPAPKKRVTTTPKSGASTAPKKKRAKEEAVAAAAPSPEMARLKKYHNELDSFQLDEEPAMGSPAPAMFRDSVPTPETALAKRPRAEIDLVSDADPVAMREEIAQLREKLAKVSTGELSVKVACFFVFILFVSDFEM